MSGYQLYTFYRSSTAWRVRIALNLKQMKPQYQFVNLFKGEQRSEEYKKVNPNTGVPSLILPDGTALIESMAIIEFLDEIQHHPYPLFQGSPVHRAQVRGFCEVINSGIHPYQNLKLIEHLNKEYGTDKAKWSVEWTTKGLHTIEALINKLGKSEKYVFGNTITAADVFFYPQVLGTKSRWGVDLAPFSNISRILGNLQKIKEFRDAEPENQPDAEPPKK
jgi:maleylacetoacetate isomerase